MLVENSYILLGIFSKEHVEVQLDPGKDSRQNQSRVWISGKVYWFCLKSAMLKVGTFHMLETMSKLVDQFVTDWSYGTCFSVFTPVIICAKHEILNYSSVDFRVDETRSVPWVTKRLLLFYIYIQT